MPATSISGKGVVSGDPLAVERSCVSLLQLHLQVAVYAQTGEVAVVTYYRQLRQDRPTRDPQPNPSAPQVVTKAPPEALLLFLKHAALEPNWTPAHSLKLPLNPFPAEQNWSFLADPSQREDFFDPAKYIPFGDNPQMYFSIGFEYRIQYEYFDNWMFGAGASRRPWIRPESGDAPCRFPRRQ